MHACFGDVMLKVLDVFIYTKVALRAWVNNKVISKKKIVPHPLFRLSQ